MRRRAVQPLTLIKSAEIINNGIRSRLRFSIRFEIWNRNVIRSDGDGKSADAVFSASVVDSIHESAMELRDLKRQFVNVKIKENIQPVEVGATPQLIFNGRPGAPTIKNYICIVNGTKDV